MAVRHRVLRVRNAAFTSPGPVLFLSSASMRGKNAALLIKGSVRRERVNKDLTSAAIYGKLCHFRSCLMHFQDGLWTLLRLCLLLLVGSPSHIIATRAKMDLSIFRGRMCCLALGSQCENDRPAVRERAKSGRGGLDMYFCLIRYPVTDETGY